MTLWASKQLIELKQYFESQKDPILQIVTPNADSLKNKLTSFNVKQVNIMQLAITFDKKNINVRNIKRRRGFNICHKWLFL